ncbi:MAG: hypothetical protein ACRECM_06905, partial [Methyloceanibacter sp.]
MLTRVLFALALICGTAAAAPAEETKVPALGLADHAVTEEELAKGEAPPVPRFNSPGVAYALVANLRKGDVVEVALMKGDESLLHNTETLAEDRASLLLQAGKRGVPAGGWPEGSYQAALKVTRDGIPLIEQATQPF